MKIQQCPWERCCRGKLHAATSTQSSLCTAAGLDFRHRLLCLHHLLGLRRETLTGEHWVTGEVIPVGLVPRSAACKASAQPPCSGMNGAGIKPRPVYAMPFPLQSLPPPSPLFRCHSTVTQSWGNPISPVVSHKELNMDKQALSLGCTTQV